uniref:ABC transporter ATP-binding protein n=1 Tax=Agathobacter sp. TaxID=2021311 RepID=UPI003FEDBFB4
MENVKLKVENVSKKLNKEMILSNINLELPEGSITGIIGENGSGKSMFFRVLAGLVMATEGKILYDGRTFEEAKPSIGLVMDDVSMYPGLTGRENLQTLAAIRKVATKEDVVHALERVGLDPKDRRTFRKYSLGMKHRLVLAQAIMEKPDFLFLDEPTNAIDEAGVRLFYKIVREEALRGAVVLISSHINSDIRELTEEIYKMEHGVLQRYKYM